MDSRPDRSRRAVARQRWPVRKTSLGDARGADLSATTTAEERLAMMWPLALDSWSFTGQPIPQYQRAHAPVRRLPRGAS